MNGRMRLAGPVMILLGLMFAVAALATPRFARETKATCATCHARSAGGGALTDAGKAFKADSTKVPKPVADDAAYVSNSKCKTCHIKEYKSWQATPHAKALATLLSADDTKVAEMAGRLGVKLEGPAAKSDVCLSCHVTGFQLPGGYPAADSTKTAGLSGMTCEGCHGPGSKHVAAAKADKKAAINGTVGESYCRSCHTPVMSPKFDYEEYKAKGLHAMKVAE